MEVIEARIVKLERRCRILTVSLVSLILAAIGIAAAPGDGETKFDLLHVKRLAIVDDAGKPRIGMMIHDGDAIFSMMVPGAETPGFTISSGKTGTKQTFSDQKNKKRVEVLATEDASAVSVLDNSEQTRLIPTTIKSNQAFLVITNGKGAVTQSFESDSGRTETPAKPKKKK